MEDQRTFWKQSEVQRDLIVAGTLCLALCMVLLYDWIVVPEGPPVRAAGGLEAELLKQVAGLGEAIGGANREDGPGELGALDANAELEKLQALAKLAGLKGMDALDALDAGAKPSIPPVADLPPLNAQVLLYAESHVGEQVGNGECWTLANEALIQAHAEPADEYVFGKEVPLTNVLPGDVLQFYEAHFEGPDYFMTAGAPHHTAIVTGKSRTRVDILHQNVNDVRTVQRGWMDFAHMTAGTVRAYRPVPKKP